MRTRLAAENERGLLRREPQVVGLLRIADHACPKGVEARLGAIELLPAGGDRRSDARLIDRLLDHEPGLLLPLAQQRYALVLDPWKSGRLPGRLEQLVERRIHRVQQVADRDVDGPAAVGNAVSRGELQYREVPRTRLIECRDSLLDAGRAGAQLEVGGQRVVEHLLNAVLDGACMAGLQIRLSQRSAEAEQRQPAGVTQGRPTAGAGSGRRS